MILAYSERKQAFDTDEKMSARSTALQSQPSVDRTRTNRVVLAGMALRQRNLEKELIETRDALFALQIEAETRARERTYEEAPSTHQTQMRVHSRSAVLGSMRGDAGHVQMDTDMNVLKRFWDSVVGEGSGDKKRRRGEGDEEG